jgi:hypothetical protein
VKVNLFDNTFRGDASSVRGRAPAHHQYVRDAPQWQGVTLYVDGFAIWPDATESTHKLAWLHEPPCLGEMHTVYNDIMHNSHRFEKVLTYHPGLLALAPDKYKFQPYGGCWIPEAEWGLRSKPALCSMLIGDKMATAGHRLRHEIAELVRGQVQFYGTKGIAVGYEPGVKLRVNGDYMFTIVTETCRIDNLFTEWLLDPLAVGTVPIFWGCPNVAEFFDPRGILSFETAEECYQIVCGLTPELYESLLPYVWENAAAMRPWASPDDLMYEQYLKEYDNGATQQ